MGEFAPSTVILLRDATELAPFEDIVAATIDPNYARFNQGAWQGRVALKELIRPPRFNGTIRDIALEIMEEPHARLLDVRERGFMLSGAGAGKSDDVDIARFYKGFHLTATPASSRPGDLGQIQADIWYGPPTQSSKGHGMPIRRFVTKPRFERERIVRHAEASKQIGLTVLRDALTHPRRGGLVMPR